VSEENMRYFFIMMAFHRMGRMRIEEIVGEEQMIRK
jgi:hypothetical protein